MSYVRALCTAVVANYPYFSRFFPTSDYIVANGDCLSHRTVTPVTRAWAPGPPNARHQNLIITNNTDSTSSRFSLRLNQPPAAPAAVTVRCPAADLVKVQAGGIQ
eukprot:g80638.t1